MLRPASFVRRIDNREGVIGLGVHLERHIPVATGFERGLNRICAFARRHALIMRAIDERDAGLDLSGMLVSVTETNAREQTL